MSDICSTGLATQSPNDVASLHEVVESRHVLLLGLPVDLRQLELLGQANDILQRRDHGDTSLLCRPEPTWIRASDPWIKPLVCRLEGWKLGYPPATADRIIILELSLSGLCILLMSGTYWPFT